jgi:hypothetical protein
MFEELVDWLEKRGVTRSTINGIVICWCFGFRGEQVGLLRKEHFSKKVAKKSGRGSYFTCMIERHKSKDSEWEQHTMAHYDPGLEILEQLLQSTRNGKDLLFPQWSKNEASKTSEGS